MVEFSVAETALKEDDLAVDLLEVVLQVDLRRVLLVAQVAGELLQALVDHQDVSVSMAQLLLCFKIVIECIKHLFRNRFNLKAILDTKPFSD